MFTSVLFALLVSAVPAIHDTATSNSAEPLEVTIGDMTVSGKAIKLTSGQSNPTNPNSRAFECTIDGGARFSLGSDGDTEITITAQKMVVMSDGNSELSIRCTGDCKSTDSDYTCSADRLQIHFAKQVRLQLSGNAAVQFGTEDDRMTIAGESITFHDGKFNVSGFGTFTRGK